MENHVHQPQLNPFSPLPVSVSRQTERLSLDLLNRAIQMMTTGQDINTTLEQFISEVNTLLEAENTSLLLHNPHSDKLVFSAVAAPHAKSLLGTKLPRNRGIANWVLAEKQSIWL